MAGMPPPGMSGPPPGAPPPPMPPPMPPPPAPGLTPGAIPPSLLGAMTDLSTSHSNEYQLLDAALRVLQTALDTGGFIDEPDVRAHVQAHYQDLKRLLDTNENGRADIGTPPVDEGGAAPSSTNAPAPGMGGDNEDK